MRGQMPKMRLRGRAELVLLGIGLTGTLALGGCGIGPFGTLGAPSVSTILQKASAIQITSEDFTEAFGGLVGGMNSSGSYEVKHTTNPDRTDITFDIISPNGKAVGEVINDGATNTSYEKLAEPASSTSGKWLKTDKFDVFQTASDIGPYLDFKDDTNAKLAGADTVNGTAVWHLTRDIPGGNTGSVTEDLYFAQSGFKPVKIVIKATGTNASTTTIAFKAINDNSISISLPSTV